MTYLQEQILKDRLKQCDTVREMFKVLDEYLLLEDCRPNTLKKNTIILGLMKGVKLMNADIRPLTMSFEKKQGNE